MASEELRNWRLGLSLRERQKYMYQGRYRADVTIVVGQGEKQESLPAHKFVLISGSPVFDELLAEDPSSKVLNVEDADRDIFKEMLQYLYYEEVEIKAENALQLLITSKKYDIVDLAEKCSKFLKENVSVKNVCTILNSCVSHEEADLTSQCLSVIATDPDKVLKSDGLLLLSNEALIEVLKSDSLAVVDAVEVYRACVKWADACCEQEGREVNDENRRSVLGEALYEIPFLQMSFSTFAEITGGLSSVLTHTERLYIYDYLGTSGKCPSVGDYGCKSFKIKGHLSSASPIEIVRFHLINKSRNDWWNYETKSPDSIGFSVNKKILIKGIGLYGGRQPSSHNVSVKLVDDCGKILASRDTIIKSDGSDKIYPVHFTKPVKLAADVKYGINAKLSGPVTYFGEQGHTLVTSDSLCVKFHAVISSNGTNDRKGQIPLLYFLNV